MSTLIETLGRQPRIEHPDWLAGPIAALVALMVVVALVAISVGRDRAVRLRAP